MSFWGELYVRTTEPLFTEAKTSLEVGYLGWCFLSLQSKGPLLDLGCGIGRHSGRLAKLTGRPVIGLEADPYSVDHRLPGYSMIRANLMALPFKPRSVAGAYCWYNTLFSFDPESASHILRSVASTLVDGGRMVVQGYPPERRKPNYQLDHTFEDGSRLLEVAVMDEVNNAEELRRTFHLPDGRILEGTLKLHYYSAEALSHLFTMAGFEVRWVHGGPDRSPLSSESMELIIAADVRHG